MALEPHLSHRLFCLPTFEHGSFKNLDFSVSEKSEGVWVSGSRRLEASGDLDLDHGSQSQRPLQPSTLLDTEAVNSANHGN